MVSIGGDRATNADYKRANKEAVARSRKIQPRADKSGVREKVNSTKLWRQAPARQQQRAVPREQQAAAAKPRQVQGLWFDQFYKNGQAPGTNPSGPQKPKSFDDFVMGGHSEGVTAPLRTPLGQKTPQQVAEETNSQPGVAPANPTGGAPVGDNAAGPPAMSDSVRAVLNSQNWKLPKEKKRVEMSKKSFEKGGLTDLKDHDYTLNSQEWTRIQDTYGSPAAEAAGYKAPKEATADLDKSMPLVKLEDQESAALTWEAYEKLSGNQKAAIDFNTLLVDAREADLQKPQALDATKRTEYDQKVEKMFGKGFGSDTVAINTVDLLSQLDMKVVGQDLDEYLSLERSIDTKELADFKFSKGDVRTLQGLASGGAATPDQADQYAALRTPENLAKVDTAGVLGAQNLIKQKMADPGTLDYSFDALMSGKTINQGGPPPVGYGDQATQWSNDSDKQLDKWLQDSLMTLGAEDPTQFGVPAGTDPMAHLLGQLDYATQGDKKIEQQFLDYVGNKTMMTQQYGTKEDATVAALIAKRAGLGGN